MERRSSGFSALGIRHFKQTSDRNYKERGSYHHGHPMVPLGAQVQEGGVSRVRRRWYLPARSAPGRRSRAKRAPRGPPTPARDPSAGPGRSPPPAAGRIAAARSSPLPPVPTRRPCFPNASRSSSWAWRGRTEQGGATRGWRNSEVGGPERGSASRQHPGRVVCPEAKGSCSAGP